MNNDKLEKLMNVNAAIALIFIMIIKGKVGFVMGVVFSIIAISIGGVCHKRGMYKKSDTIEKIFVIVFFAVSVLAYYLYAFTDIFNGKILMFLSLFEAVWFFGGFLILYIRKRRRERK